MDWLQGKAVEFILKILSSKLDGTSSIFLEKVNHLLFIALISSSFCLILEYLWEGQNIILITLIHKFTPNH